MTPAEAEGHWEDFLKSAVAEAEKAMRKFPQPNYVISKVAEEAGEVVKAAIHCAEARETAENVRDEMRQLIAMLYRLWVEGDQVHGLPPVSTAALRAIEGGRGMTHPTDEELDALVKRLTWAAGIDQAEYPFPMCNEAADAITALRAQLARREEMHECAMEERDDATIYADEQKARADRAEAERAAQIEADAGLVRKFAKGHFAEGMILERAALNRVAALISRQPHDRTALDRIIAATRANALRDAATKATSFLVGDPQNGIPLRSPMTHEVADAILAMIDKPIMSGDDTGR